MIEDEFRRSGQNGALIAAMLVSGLTLIERRPVLAGALLAGLCIKPQFMLLLQNHVHHQSLFIQSFLQTHTSWNYFCSNQASILSIRSAFFKPLTVIFFDMAKAFSTATVSLFS